MTAPAPALRSVPVIPGPAPGYPVIPGPRVPLLDVAALTKGIYSEFYDPDGAVYGLPTYPYRWAPEDLRDAAAAERPRAAPGGPGALRSDHLEAPRQAPVCLPVPGRAGAAEAADDAGEVGRAGDGADRPTTCPLCGQVKRYCIPTSVGWCNDCAAGSTP